MLLFHSHSNFDDSKWTNFQRVQLVARFYCSATLYRKEYFLALTVFCLLFFRVKWKDFTLNYSLFSEKCYNPKEATWKLGEWFSIDPNMDIRIPLLKTREISNTFLLDAKQSLILYNPVNLTEKLHCFLFLYVSQYCHHFCRMNGKCIFIGITRTFPSTSVIFKKFFRMQNHHCVSSSL